MEAKSKKRGYRKYDLAFKKEVVSQIESGRSVQEIAQGLGISESLLYKWKNQLTSATLKSSGSTSQVKALEQRIKNLEKDNEILKKALRIFAQQN